MSDDRCEKCGSRVFCLCIETDGQMILAMFVAAMVFACAIALFATSQPASFSGG